MDLVYELFSKLGLRYICVLKDGKYAGMVGLGLRAVVSSHDHAMEADKKSQTHKKTFVRYMREHEE